MLSTYAASHSYQFANVPNCFLRSSDPLNTISDDKTHGLPFCVTGT